MSARSAALITGGAGDIGRAVARRLADRGIHVVVADIDGGGAAEVAKDVGGSAVTLDVGDAGSWHDVTKHLDRREFALDAAVFNAGVALGESELLDVDLDCYRRAWSVNVDGVVLGLRALVPRLRATRGQVVITSSLAGLTAVPFDPVYAMTKHAIIGLVRGYGPTLSEHHVGLHAVCPGLVDTALLGDARETLEALEFPLVTVTAVATALTDCALGDDPSEVVIVQPGRPPTPYRFSGVPGGAMTMPSLPARLPIGNRHVQESSS